VPPTAGPRAGRIGDRYNAAAPLHHGGGFPDTQQEGGGLGIERHPPVVQRDVERRLVEVLYIRPGVGNEDAERTQTLSCFGKHAGDVGRLRHIGLDQDSFGTAFLEEAGCLARGGLIPEVVDPNLGNAALGEFECDASADTSGTAGDQRGP
jgi:hypothetical protein